MPTTRSPQSSPRRAVLLAGVLLAVLGVWLALRGGGFADAAPGGADAGAAGVAHAAATGHASRSGGDASPGAAADGPVRVLHVPAIRVVDAATGTGIAGADVRLFDDDDRTVGRARSHPDGRVVLPTDLPVAGLSAHAAGYRFDAVETGEECLALARAGAVEVVVRGASARLLADYGLLAGLRYGGKGYPLEWARLHRAAGPPRLVAVRNGRCTLERTLFGLGTVVLIGRHRGTGGRQQFDRAVIAADEHRVVFDASRYRQPSGNWLRLTVELPRHQDAYRAYVDLDYRETGRWLPVRVRRSVKTEPGAERFTEDLVELWPGRYRVRCEFATGPWGEYHSTPFEVRGATVHTVRVIEKGGSIRVDCIGPLRDGIRDDKLRLFDAANRNPTTLRRYDDAGVLRITNVPPGTYWLRCNDSTLGVTILPRRVVVEANGTARLQVTPAASGTLVVRTTAGRAGVHITDSVGEAIEGVIRYHGRDGWVAQLPRGRYGVRIGDGQVEFVQVGAGTTKFTPPGR